MTFTVDLPEWAPLAGMIAGGVVAYLVVGAIVSGLIDRVSPEPTSAAFHTWVIWSLFAWPIIAMVAVVVVTVNRGSSPFFALAKWVAGRKK